MSVVRSQLRSVSSIIIRNAEYRMQLILYSVFRILFSEQLLPLFAAGRYFDIELGVTLACGIKIAHAVERLLREVGA